MRIPKPNGSPRIVPSLLGADFGDIRGELKPLARAGVDWVSLDVMDGHFVPNLSFGPDVIKALRKRGPRVKVDAHLMVDNPADMAPVFARAGADWVIVHAEACPRPRPVLRALRRAGVGAGLAINPKTRLSAITSHLGEIDIALLMTVQPGFGGQSFMAEMLPKIRRLRREIDRRGLDVWLQVDGGINASSVARVAAAGADSLVAGSAVFRAPDPAAAFRSLRRAARRAFRK